MKRLTIAGLSSIIGAMGCGWVLSDVDHMGRLGPNAAAILFGEDEPLDADMLHDFFPVAVVAFEQIAIDFAAKRADVAMKPNLSAVGKFIVDGIEHFPPSFRRN